MYSSTHFHAIKMQFSIQFLHNLAISAILGQISTNWVSKNPLLQNPLDTWNTLEQSDILQNPPKTSKIPYPSKTLQNPLKPFETF